MQSLLLNESVVPLVDGITSAANAAAYIQPTNVKHCLSMNGTMSTLEYTSGLKDFSPVSAPPAVGEVTHTSAIVISSQTHRDVPLD